MVATFETRDAAARVSFAATTNPGRREKGTGKVSSSRKCSAAKSLLASGRREQPESVGRRTQTLARAVLFTVSAKRVGVLRCDAGSCSSVGLGRRLGQAMAREQVASPEYGDTERLDHARPATERSVDVRDGQRLALTIRAGLVVFADTSRSRLGR